MKKLFLITTLLLLPTVAFAVNPTTQSIFTNVPAQLSATATQFLNVGTDTTIGTVATQGTVMPTSGIIQNLTIYLVTAPSGSATRTLTVVDNTVATTLTCTVVGSAQTCADHSHTVAVSAGDIMLIKSVPSGTPAVTFAAMTFDFTPTTPGQTAILSRSVVSQTAYEYEPLTSATGAGAPEANDLSLIPESGVISNLYLNAVTAPGAGTSYTTYFRDNSATTSVTCAISGTLTPCNDTTDSASVAAGDFVNYVTVPSNTPVNTGVDAGIMFTPTVVGDFDTIGGYYTISSTTATVYSPLIGGITAATNEASEQANSVVASSPTVITTLYVYLGSGVAGTGKSRQFTIMDNGNPTSLTCSIGGATARECSITGLVHVSAGDLLDLQDIPSGTPTGTRVWSSIVAQVVTPAQAVQSQINVWRGFLRILGGHFLIK